MGKSKQELTVRQQRFVDEYTVDFNGTQAAIRSGYKHSNANRIASDNLSKPYIQEAIREKLTRIEENTECTREQVIGELIKIAFGDITNVIEFGPTGIVAKDSNALPKKHTAAVEEISEVAVGDAVSTKVKMYNKTKALELLGKYFGIFVDRKELMIGRHEDELNEIEAELDDIDGSA